MHIVLGATGRVGQAVVRELLRCKEPVRAVIRDPSKAVLFPAGVEVRVANYFDRNDLVEAVKGGNSICLLTPENITTSDFIGDTRLLLENYNHALSMCHIDRLVGLSSGGAQHSSGTGNLVASYLLENSFTDLSADQFFLRSGYYYSNWMGYIEIMREHGILPTFFPPDLKILMISPEDVGKYAARILCKRVKADRISEIGNKEYSSQDIAKIFSKHLDMEVTAIQTPRDLWKKQLLDVGFSNSAAENLILMTEAVISGKTKSNLTCLPMPTTFEEYLKLGEILVRN